MTQEKARMCAGLLVKKKAPGDRVIALAGNPNVGKSTIFNALTGMNQHTGNWPGKTVVGAQGYYRQGAQGYVMVDIPGCYSLMAHSSEEEAARDLICFGEMDAVIVVCDATCLERNLNLVLQVIEATPRVVVCVNLMDEARKKKLALDLEMLARRLGVPVVGTAARSLRGLRALTEALDGLFSRKPPIHTAPVVPYPAYIENAIARMMPIVRDACGGKCDARWLCARLLDANAGLCDAVGRYLGIALTDVPEVARALREARKTLAHERITEEKLRDDLAGAFIGAAERACRGVVVSNTGDAHRRDRRLDRLFTGRLTGFPIMLLMLLGIFWITIIGANGPSEMLAEALLGLEAWLEAGLVALGAKAVWTEMLVRGVYRVMAWVISVMLPPMAIFFPLFTLLEDFGYLPRVAFNLDRCFNGCRACGKQALTMSMGFGCNAVGVVGCRIIDSPRERLIAILTNSFVPCNGRFPTIIAIITLCLLGGAPGMAGGFMGALILVAVIALGVGMTLLVSRGLSATLLKGVPSSFTLELPPYRRPQVGKVIVRSIVDRTLKVLGRAVVAAAPAGLIIWVLANLHWGGSTFLARLTGFIDPLGRALGMDGVILTGFILGFPANEIVVPIIIMAYLAQGTLTQMGGAELSGLLAQNGWTWITAVSTILFSLMHWPCATTCLTIKKETQSLKWTIAAILIPTLSGLVTCALFSAVARLF
ncbi:MAG: ferrous iron transport protein B [Clostridia bacterium]